jgi:hypothetical protein
MFSKPGVYSYYDCVDRGGGGGGWGSKGKQRAKGITVHASYLFQTFLENAVPPHVKNYVVNNERQNKPQYWLLIN